MPLKLNIKKSAGSRHRIQRSRKRQFSKRNPSRSSTIDSINSLDSRNSESPGDELRVSPRIEAADCCRSEAQVIPFQHLDEWALFIFLENTFGANNFKIEQTYEAFNVWAPRELGEDDIESCMS